MGIPEKCWRGCWHRCWQKWGCWPECWHRCWQDGLFGKRETKQPASTCASTPASTPIFASTCASTPASTFLEFLFWGPVPGRRDLKSWGYAKEIWALWSLSEPPSRDLSSKLPLTPKFSQYRLTQNYYLRKIILK